MAIPHAKPGEIVDVRPLGSALASAQTKTLVRAEQVEIIRLVVPAGKEIAEHKAKGEIVVHCLEGRVAFTAFGKTQNLETGKLLCLPKGEPHTVKGIENASLLLTVLLPKH
jgi:quercetin dioxygenase-like cupin family protein